MHVRALAIYRACRIREKGTMLVEEGYIKRDP